ncbi:Programmed cell death protein 2 [Balamuthia mandrillaris]
MEKGETVTSSSCDASSSSSSADAPAPQQQVEDDASSTTSSSSSCEEPSATREEAQGEGKVFLGFVEKAPRRLINYPFLLSKVGGKPVWLIPKDVPSSEQLQCPHCEAPMPLLLQVYAPLSHEDTYHRFLYVFACKDGACHQRLPNGSFKVLRCQLPKDNPYYLPVLPSPSPSSPSQQQKPNKEKEKEETDTESECEEDDDAPRYRFVPPSTFTTCIICGAGAPKRCGKCKAAHYCSRAHQVLHWPQHKLQCASLDANTKQQDANNISKEEEEEEEQHPALWPEFEIVTEAEGPPTETEKALSEKELKERYGAIPIVHPQGKDDPDADFEMKYQADGSFVKFQQRISRDPDQCLRYYADPTKTEALWVSNTGRPSSSTDIPPCARCGASCSLEFQVMPQLLHFLDVEKVASLAPGEATPSVNWGTLLIYTCSRSCSIVAAENKQAAEGEQKTKTEEAEGGMRPASSASSFYTPEFLWRQML